MTHENNIKNIFVAVLDDGSDNPGVYNSDDARSPNTINAVTTTVSIAYPAGIFPHSWYIVGVNRFCNIGHAGFANKLKKCREDSAVPAVIKLLKLLLLRQENPGRNEATQWPLMHDLRAVSVKKMSYRYRDFHWKDKTAVRPSYSYKENPHNWRNRLNKPSSTVILTKWNRYVFVFRE